MNEYQVINNQLINDLISPSQNLMDTKSQSTSMSQDLQNLLNLLPYYQESVNQSVLKNSLINIFKTKLPNNSIAAQPSDYGFGYSISYEYKGNYNGYKDAFYHGVSLTSSGSNVLKQVGNIVDGNYWSGYSVALLTDAIRKKVSVSLDSNKLQDSLRSYSSQTSKILSPSYLGIFTDGYEPTQNAFNAIQDKNSALNELDNAIANGQFTANVNQALSVPGDSASAATWFLFNLWISLKALGMQDVDSAIKQYKKNGLNIPIEVDAKNWWDGHYSSWFAPLDGSYISSSTITASMPEESYSYFSGSMFPAKSSQSVQNGYSQSLTNWGNLDYYKPQSSSCFGKDTCVLMADSSIKKISQIQIGDSVYTKKGAKKVILVESPLRNFRELYQINNLHLFVTYAHPFKSEDKVLAINPWVLKDTITTFAHVGVGYLKVGSKLEGKDSTVEVKQIDIVNDGTKDEKVFDLILEDAAKGDFGYFVGGEDTFVEVLSESADPMSYPYVSTVVINSMNAIKNGCSIQNKNLDNILPGLTLEAKEPGIDTVYKLAAVPSIDFFIKDGLWDEDSSYLEHSIISLLSKNLRREIESGWKIKNENRGDTLCIGINDIELVDIGMKEGKVSFLLKPQDEKLVEYSFNLTSPYSAKIDDVVYIDVQDKVSSIYVYLMDLQAHINLEDMDQKYGDYFLYDINKNIKGSINLDFRYLNKDDILVEKTQKENYSKNQKTKLAVGLAESVYDFVSSALSSKTDMK